MTDLKIFPGVHDRIHTLLAAYQAWCRSKSWKHQHHTPLLSASDTGIPVFAWNDAQGINDSTSPVCIIDHSKENPNAVKTLLTQLNGNKHYIIFDGSRWHQNKLPTDHSHTVMYWPFLLLDLVQVHTNIESPYFYHQNQYSFEYPKSSLFTHISGTGRRHRDWFVNNLLPELKTQNFIFRYRGQDHGCDSSGWDLINQPIGEGDIPTYFQQFPDNFAHRVLVRSMSLETYNQSYFALVIETVVDHTDCVFVTEKTGRCLLSGQPFVVASSPGYLQHLQQMGFKTYGTLWDESYDSIQDTSLRMHAVKNLSKELTLFDWQQHKNQLERIAIHNRMTFLNWQNFVSQLFEDIEIEVKKFLQTGIKI